MAKKYQEVSKLLDESTLNNLFIYAIKARDAEAIDIIIKKAKINITEKELFAELLSVVEDDNNIELIKSVIKGLDIDLSKQTDEELSATLLGNAAIYGSTKIGEFLINRKFNPNHQDAQGHTALHRAVLYNQLDFVDLLAKHNVNPQIKDEKGFTALVWAYATRNESMSSKLKHTLGAKLKIPKNYDLSSHTFFPPPLDIGGEQSYLPKPITLIKHSDFYKGATICYKTILSEKNDEENFPLAIYHIKNFLNKLTKSEDNKSLAQEALNILTTVYQYYKKDNTLQQYIIDKGESWDEHFVLALLYNEMCIECLESSDYQKALEYINTAQEKINLYTVPEKQKAVVEKLQHGIYFHMGQTWQHIDVTQSPQHFLQALSIKKKDQDAVLQLSECYMMCNDEDKSDKQIKSITNKDIKNLYLIKHKLRFQSDFTLLPELKNFADKTTDKEIKKLYDIMMEFASQEGASITNLCDQHKFNLLLLGRDEGAKYISYIQIWTQHFRQQQSYDKVIDCLQALHQHRDSQYIAKHLLETLDIYKMAESWEKGFAYIIKMYQDNKDILTQHKSLPLKYLEFIFYKTNNNEDKAQECLTFLKNQPTNQSTKAETMLHFMALNFAMYVAIASGEFEQALTYLEENLEPSPKLELLVKKLKQEASNIEPEPSQSETDTTLISDVIDIELLEEPAAQQSSELTTFIDALDPKRIHAYFQYKKQELLKKSIEAGGKEASSNWNTQNRVYISNEKSIYPIENKPNFYATISSKLKLPDNLLGQFNDALSKGIASKTYKSNGIKFLHAQHLIELKISGDDRLYTDHIYKNHQGKFLIEFDKHGKHKDVEQYPIQKHWQVIETVPITTPFKDIKETESFYAIQPVTEELEYCCSNDDETVVLSGANNYDID